jgi:hypothetical protein
LGCRFECSQCGSGGSVGRPGAPQSHIIAATKGKPDFGQTGNRDTSSTRLGLILCRLDGRKRLTEAEKKTMVDAGFAPLV